MTNFHEGKEMNWIIDNPLNEYLTELRELEENYALLFYEQSKNETIDMSLFKKQEEISLKIGSLKKSDSLKARDFDLFINKEELALAEFEAENPKPEDTLKACTHEVVELRKMIQSNDSIHIVEQCLNCGKKVKVPKKNSNVNYEVLSHYDTEIGNDIRTKLSEWHRLRNKIGHDAYWEGDEIPTFDTKDFNDTYTKENPEPFASHLCKHDNQEYRLRTYPQGGTAVVSQCIDCGHHLKDIAKSKVKNMSNLSAFDVDIKKNQYSIHAIWRSKKADQEKLAKENFLKQRNEDLKNGKYNFKTNSTFNTYYNSTEWKNTRIRILERDSHLCQACGEDARCVHHIVYDRLGKENDLDLMSLCTDCHNEVHRRQNKFSYSYRLTPIEISTLWEWE